MSTYLWWKEKKSVFLHMEKKKDFSSRIYVQKDWLRDHTSWAPYGIEMKIKGILKFWLWISLHQGTLSILYSRIQGYMLSFMNEVDPCLLLPLCVLYEIQNQIFQQFCLRSQFVWTYFAQHLCNLWTLWRPLK